MNKKNLKLVRLSPKWLAKHQEDVVRLAQYFHTARLGSIKTGRVAQFQLTRLRDTIKGSSAVRATLVNVIAGCYFTRVSRGSVLYGCSRWIARKTPAFTAKIAALINEHCWANRATVEEMYEVCRTKEKVVVKTEVRLTFASAELAEIYEMVLATNKRLMEEDGEELRAAA